MMVDQQTFRAALLDADAERPAGLTDGAGAPAGRRFDVYRNNVAVSLTEALETAFPVVAKLVGDQNFKLLAGAFLRAHPPQSPLMMFYGAAMPAFLESFGPTSQIGYLPDVARLELALRESYHAADASPVDTSLVAALPPEDLMAATVALAPSLRLIRSPWPIHAIWMFNAVANAPKPAMAAEDVAVFRVDYDPEPVLLPPGAAAFLAALLDGATFGAAFDQAADTVEGFDLTPLLALLLTKGAIVHIGDTP